MKAIVAAKPLAAALQQAAGLADTKSARSIAALEAARLATMGDTVTITTNALDHVLATTLPAVGVEVAGEVAVSAARLAALAASFPSESAITITGADGIATIVCGRARFRLPTVPIADLPLTPAVDQEIGRIELERGQLLDLIRKTEFAISTEQARYYLHGVLLHDSPNGLTAVATDGHRLARGVLPGVTGLPQDHRLIVPRPAIKVLLKLLDKGIDRLTMRCSSSLIEIAGANFTFVSKLIDATFPAYERLVPEPSGNAATVGRAELARAFARIVAVAPASKVLPTVGLSWEADEPALRLCVPGWPDLAEDLIAAETSGTSRIAFQIRHGLDLLDALKGERVHIDCGSTVRGNPIRISNPDEPNHLVIQMPVTWLERAAEAA